MYALHLPVILMLAAISLFSHSPLLFFAVYTVSLAAFCWDALMLPLPLSDISWKRLSDRGESGGAETNGETTLCGSEFRVLVVSAWQNWNSFAAAWSGIVTILGCPKADLAKCCMCCGLPDGMSWWHLHVFGWSGLPWDVISQDHKTCSSEGKRDVCLRVRRRAYLLC